jgi:hypothetical protein
MAPASALRSSLLLFGHSEQKSSSGGGEPSVGLLLLRRPSGVEVVHTRGDGTGVPPVMAP